PILAVPPSRWMLSLRTEAAASLPPSVAVLGLTFVVEQPARSILDLLSGRGSIILLRVDADPQNWVGAGAGAGVRIPLADVQSARFEAEVTCGGGAIRSGPAIKVYGEGRFALLGRFALTDTLEIPVSISAAAIAPGSFATGISGGIGLAL